MWEFNKRMGMKLLEHSINASFHSLVLSAKHHPPTAASLLETAPLKTFDLSSPPHPSHPPDCSGVSKQLCCSARNSRGTTTDVLVFGWNVYSLEAAVGLSPLERVFQEVSPRFRPSHSSGSLEMRAVWKRIRASPVLTETHGFVSERTLFPRSPVVASEITRMP